LVTFTQLFAVLVSAVWCLQRLGRSLQQAAQVTVVSTAAALNNAVVSGANYIEIRAHLDLTTLPQPEVYFLTPKATTTVIRVRQLEAAVWASLPT
jgi:hypothetical protein